MSYILYNIIIIITDKKYYNLKFILISIIIYPIYIFILYIIHNYLYLLNNRKELV